MILSFNIRGGRKYPSGGTVEAVMGLLRMPERGTVTAPVVSLPPAQRLHIGITLNIRGGLM